MDIEALRVEMLKCHKNTSTGIMFGAGKAYLMWDAGNEMHSESIQIDKCAIGSEEFKGACERATISLIH